MHKIKLNTILVYLKNHLINIIAIILGLIFAFFIFILYKGIVNSLKSEDIVSKAIENFNKEHYSKAIYLFEEAKKKYPDNKIIYLYLARLYSYKGLNENVLDNYDKFIQKGGELEKEDLSIYGNILYQQKQYEKLIYLWNGSVELPSKDYFLLAKTYFALDDIENYKINLKKVSNYYEPFLELQVFEKDIDVLFNNLSFFDTLPSLNISKYELDPEVYISLIKNAKSQKDKGNKYHAELFKFAAFINNKQCKVIFQDLKQLLDEYKKNRYDTNQLTFFLGKCYNQLGDWEKALPLINMAINWDKSNMEYREELAYNAYLKGDKDYVRKIYEDILIISKQSRYLINYASYLYEFGEKENALIKLKEAFDLANNDKLRSKLSKQILKIALSEVKDKTICFNTTYDSFLDLNQRESIFLKIICSKIRNENYDEYLKQDGLINDYFSALDVNDFDEVIQVLDKDKEGLLTFYDNIIKELDLFSNY